MLKTEAINLLLANFKAEVTDGLMQGYSIGVREYSENTVEQSVINFLQGKVSAHNSAFCPTPAELAKECDRIVNGSGGDPNSPLAKFLAANAQNTERVKREDADSLEDRQKRLAPTDKTIASQIINAPIDFSKTPPVSNHLQQAKSMSEIIKMKPGSEFVSRLNEEEKQAAQKRLDSLEQIQTQDQPQRKG